MRLRTLPATKTLTDRQKYLLNRLPSSYDLDGFVATKEPKEVARARKRVQRWDDLVARMCCVSKKRNEALRRKAQEAIYFASDTKALAIIRQVEKMLKGCGV